jgi:predicted nuclease with TOPRIM domain
MSNEQGTVTYSIADILGQINQKLEKIDERLTSLEIGQARLEERLSGEIKALDEKVDGIAKRLDYQEFINRGVIVGLILASLAGLAKIFGFYGNS